MAEQTSRARHHGGPDTLLRVYFDPAEIGPDGYPYVWHEQSEALLHPAGQPGDGPVLHLAVKDYIRDLAGDRCERCGHPYIKGQGLNEGWSPCDELCTHGGPIRAREAWAEDEWRYHESTHGHLAGEGLNDPGPDGVELARWEVHASWRILTVHHLNGIKHDLRWWNLAALCQRCHLTIQAKVHLERPWVKPHTDWFKPHAAGYYTSEVEPEPTREWVLANMDAILLAHATQQALWPT